MRVIAGSAKGHRLLPVPGDTTRPITDRVKESLFDILAFRLQGSVWLDLFAGTGGVGIEALSRGAEQVVFVDQAHRAIQILQRNLAATNLTGGAELHQGDAFRVLEQFAPSSFDYVYIAPPQYHDLWARALTMTDALQLVKPGGEAIVQVHPKEMHPVMLQHLVPTQERRYGSTLLAFYTLPLAEDPARDAAV
ncbi:MAG: 16S rRNA (guanine(966)-N(2))-methyltransferase RsmD [Chloroflexi bacterium]|nr:16S rRNA (guanine(966)-N(2))-methyltransferase RsmD [Chloroflexota bacterium]